jgi:tRNA threonylcarbamoyladenosine biosynthesis protein TsaE
MTIIHICATPQETFHLGETIGQTLSGGEALLLSGGLGAGKTLLTKGILGALNYETDEVTSPSFTLVNLYKAGQNIYHIDLWRLDDGANNAKAVGLDEILEDERAIVIVEWAEKLGDFSFPGKVFRIMIEGDGDDPRTISISEE